MASPQYIASSEDIALKKEGKDYVDKQHCKLYYDEEQHKIYRRYQNYGIGEMDKEKRYFNKDKPMNDGLCGDNFLGEGYTDCNRLYTYANSLKVYPYNVYKSDTDGYFTFYDNGLIPITFDGTNITNVGTVKITKEYLDNIANKLPRAPVKTPDYHGDRFKSLKGKTQYGIDKNRVFNNNEFLYKYAGRRSRKKKRATKRRRSNKRKPRSKQ